MARKKLIESDSLARKGVYEGSVEGKRIGRVKCCAFHPSERRCVGFVVKRPDLAWMFRRDDLFVALDGFELVSGCIVASKDSRATGAAACKRLGLNWDECVLWEGMPLVAENGETVGLVGNVTFSYPSGAVESVEVNNGATAHYLVGSLEVPASMILGFKKGIGANLAVDADCPDEGEDGFPKGGILVSDDVWSLSPEGGWAEAAGSFTAKASIKAQEAAEKMKPKAREAADVAKSAAAKGARAAEKQLKASKGMFAAFKEEYDKALRGE